MNGKIEIKQSDIATLDSKVSQLQKELRSNRKNISSLSSEKKAYIDSLSDFRNTSATLVNTQNKLQEIKKILSSTKTQVMILLDEKF